MVTRSEYAILARHFRPESGSGPSWLTFLGHVKDSLWSADIFRCESLTLRTLVDDCRKWVVGMLEGIPRQCAQRLNFADCFQPSVEISPLPEGKCRYAASPGFSRFSGRALAGWWMKT